MSDSSKIDLKKSLRKGVKFTAKDLARFENSSIGKSLLSKKKIKMNQTDLKKKKKPGIEFLTGCSVDEMVEYSISFENSRFEKKKGKKKRKLILRGIDKVMSQLKSKFSESKRRKKNDEIEEFCEGFEYQLKYFDEGISDESSRSHFREKKPKGWFFNRKKNKRIKDFDSVGEESNASTCDEGK